MRVCILDPDTPSHAVHRVHSALTSLAPSSMSFVSDRRADVVVLPSIGRRDATTRRAQKHVSSGQRIVVIQYCLRSTINPSTLDWQYLWSLASLVWSYYPLDSWIAEDGGLPLGDKFLHAPLGVDAVFTVARPRQHPSPFVCCSSGRAWTTESAREVAIAAGMVGRRVLHLGPPMRRPWVHSVSDLSDVELAELYHQCEFVSGLRRIEGFELPVIEGLLCGARPILFDRPHYRIWFEPWAEFIPEGPREQVLQDVTTLFARGARPVTERERSEAQARFSWASIASQFWSRVCASC